MAFMVCCREAGSNEAAGPAEALPPPPSGEVREAVKDDEVTPPPALAVEVPDVSKAIDGSICLSC